MWLVEFSISWAFHRSCSNTLVHSLWGVAFQRCSYQKRCNQNHQETCIYCQNHEAGSHTSAVKHRHQCETQLRPGWTLHQRFQEWLVGGDPQIPGTRQSGGREIVFDTQVHYAYESVKPIDHFQYPVFNLKRNKPFAVETSRYRCTWIRLILKKMRFRARAWLQRWPAALEDSHWGRMMTFYWNGGRMAISHYPFFWLPYK